jgi:hypothetical protein
VSQVVYTELEALPLRWPYLQLEPLDTTYTQTWGTDQTFNTPTTSTTYTPPDTGSPVEVAVYGPRKLGQALLKKSTSPYELLTNLELSVRKVGNPGPLKTEILRITPLTDNFLNDSFRENFGGATADSYTITSTSWVAQTRNITEKIKLTGIFIQFPYTSIIWRVRITTANTDGRPNMSNVLADFTAQGNTWTQLPTSLILDPGMYSVVVSLDSGTGYPSYGYHTSVFGSVHSNWTTGNSGSTWSSSTRTWGILLEAATRRKELGEKLGEYITPASAFGTTTAWTTLYHGGDLRRLLQSQDIYVVFSSPDSPDPSNCYMIQKGGTYTASPSGNIFSYAERHEVSYFTDGAASEYRCSDVLVRKTYNQYARIGYTFDKTYYLGPGSYGPYASIGIKAATGTVYALPVTISNDVFAAQQSSEKSTTSTTYTGLVWDRNADGSPEVKAPQTDPVTFLVRGNGAYNQVSFTPRLYYDKNPVTPKDFGFTELYLMRLRADAANTLVRVNERTNIYFAGSGDTVAIDPNFRAPVKKLQVITGRATADLLGVL